ncbi:MAG: o-succinylbenzoate synthase [Acidobacteriaceae bacterium]|nr:o-succinylbenzoate synthase [Acidobacteriaceae bacterium]MBV8572564.1 o-succinylbenzoate synthase [Acidobacteriaceae bacterium]
MAFQVDRVIVRQIRMPLVHPFETSFGRTQQRDIVLVEAVAGDISGYGEVTAGENPFYNEEWTGSVWPLLIDYVVPRILDHKFESPLDIAPRTKYIRGHLMARGGVETAVWDLYARLHNEPLWTTIGGGARQEIPCGVSIGIQDSIDVLIEKIAHELSAGYQRIKIKIKPGWDIDVVREVRRNFPAIKLMVDANSAYTLNDVDHLRKLDDFYLMMIEQPLAYDDILDHAVLQAAIQTPVCLDECIRSARHAEQAIRVKACQIINIKLGRVGGFAEAKRIHDVCQQNGIPVWCGGMLESGIGRAHNVALATLPDFVLPGDISASKRYWERDIIHPAVEITRNGAVNVPNGAGLGYDVDVDYVESLTIRKERLEPELPLQSS